MEDGHPIFRQDITCPSLLIDLTSSAPSNTAAITLCRRTFQTIAPDVQANDDSALFPIRALLLGESRLIPFFMVLRCFIFPGSPRQAMDLLKNDATKCTGFPIRTSPADNVSYQLTGAFRRLSCPSLSLTA